MNSYNQWTPDQRTRARELASTLPLLHAELMQLGLIKTAHAMTNAVQAIGWDIASHEAREATNARD